MSVVAFCVFAALTCTFGQILVSYESYARARNWPVGDAMSSSWATFLGGAAYAVVIKVLVVVAWWAPFVLALAAALFAFVLCQLLRSWVQIVALVGTSVGLVASFLATVRP